MRVWVPTLAAGMVLLAACSSSTAGPTPTGPVDSAFRDKANIACEAVLGVVAPTPFPSGVNPTAPAPSALPSIASYLDALPTSHEGAEFLRRLGRPAQGRASWANFVAAVGDEQAVVARQIKAAKSSNRTDYLATVQQVSAAAARIDSLGSAAGFAADSYCVQLFG